MNPFFELQKKINNKKTTIGIIGLGYVGLPLAIWFAKKGFKVTGFVRKKEKARSLVKGESSLSDIQIDRALKEIVIKKFLTIKVTNKDDLQKQDVIIICVPTPVNKDKKPDLTDLINVSKLLSQIDITNKLIINESTVAPFTTREVFGNLGKNYYLVCSPERIDPGNQSKTVEKIQKVIGGINKESLLLGTALYKQILKKNLIQVNSLEAAEMTKMLENTYRAVNIALMNEFAKLSEKCQIDILDIIKAAKSKWTFQPHYPSIGVGGHCIPVDPYYILELAKIHRVDMKVVKDGLEENESMPEYLVKKVKDNYKKGMKVLVYGLTYKKDVNDLRESPVIEFCKLLQKEGIDFFVYDPFVPPSLIEQLAFKWSNLKKVDFFIVGTDHSKLKKDYLKAIDKKTIIVDGRNFFISKNGKKILGVGRTLS